MSSPSRRSPSKGLCNFWDYTSNQIVTSEMVLTEFLNSFSDYGPRLCQAAARAVVSLRDTSEIVIVPQTSQLFEKAQKRYRDMADKSWSLTDCASFLIMEEEGIASAARVKHFDTHDPGIY